MKERLSYLDRARGISIFFVILGHFYEEYNFFSQWFYSFHVPLFFILSGILLQYKNYKLTTKDLIIKKAKELIKPYGIFCGLNFLAYLLSLVVFKELNLNKIAYRFVKIVTGYGICGLWFLPCLFICEVGLIVLIKKVKNKKAIFLIVISIYIFSLINFGNDNDYIMQIRRQCTCLLFVTLGYYLSDYIRKNNIKLIILGLFFVIQIILERLNGNVQLYSQTINNPLLFTVNSILGSIVVIFLCKKITKNKVTEYFGRNSMGILVTHFAITKGVLFAYDRFVGRGINAVFDGLIALVCVLIVEAVLIESNVLKYLGISKNKSRKLEDCR